MYAPEEKLGVVEVANFPLLGKVVAARFIEWVQANPGGVVSLPTGRTPEHFINWVHRFVTTWDDPATKAALRELGLQDTTRAPDMRSLYFYQMDEFFPIDPSQGNSFCSYVMSQYVEKFRLDPAKVRVMDLWTVGCDAGRNNGDIFADGIDVSVLSRAPRNAAEAEQAAALSEVHQFCSEYEECIRRRGGIGFFLGGIGPDGHVAFNCAGADHSSTTRLTKLNYQSAAAAASDLGGIETARKKHVVTIGLGTIRYKPDACVVVFAAGDAKARVIADAAQGAKHVSRPASAFHAHKGFRFYLTTSAASRIAPRTFDSMATLLKGAGLGRAPSAKRARVAPEWQPPPADLDPLMVDKAIADLALALDVRLIDVSEENLRADPKTAMLVDALGADRVLAACRGLRDALVGKIEQALSPIQGAEFLHTAPHHDDIMLGYLPLVNVLTKEPSNGHRFCYCTSGFNAVTNELMIHYLKMALAYVQEVNEKEIKRREQERQGPKIKRVGLSWEGCRKQQMENAVRLEYDIGDGPGPVTDGDPDVDAFLDAHAARDERAKGEAVARRVARCVAKNFVHEDTFHNYDKHWVDGLWLAGKIEAVIAYYSGQHQGQRDLPEYQALKGMLREFEADLLWGYHGFQASKAVDHLRMGFYKGALFTEEPEVNRDVLPLLGLMEAQRPTHVSVALDPEGSGPDTHYKVLQAVASACKLYEEAGGQQGSEKGGGHGSKGGKRGGKGGEGVGGRGALKVWGYRNVWFRFHPAEASLAFPVSLGETSHLNDAFVTCFISQKNASFPAPDYDGPFSHWAQMIQAEQYRQMVTLLGRNFFADHPNPRVRAARGLVFIKELTLSEFLGISRDLRFNAEGAR